MKSLKLVVEIHLKIYISSISCAAAAAADGDGVSSYRQFYNDDDDESARMNVSSKKLVSN